MSVNTPPASTGSPAPASPANNVATEQQSNALADRMVLDYLRTRGHAAAERAFANVVEAASPEDKGKQPETLTSEDLVKALAVFAQKPSRPGENVLKDTPSVLTELTSLGNPSSIQNLIASIGSVGAEDILSLDPTDKQEGFRELEAWVEGSLDMYRVSAVSAMRT